MFDNPVHVMRPDRYDEIWLMPKDGLSIPMMRTLHRCDVHLVPFIWHPQFLEQRIAEVSEHGLQFRISASARTSLDDPPQRRASGLRFRAEYFGSENVEHPDAGLRRSLSSRTFERVAHACAQLAAHEGSSDAHANGEFAELVKDSTRQRFTAAMTSQDSWRNSPMRSSRINGATTRIIFISTCSTAAIRLVHNSPWLKDAGYYYPGFDSQEGGRQLLRASREHDASLDDYRARAQRVIDSVESFQSSKSGSLRRSVTEPVSGKRAEARRMKSKASPACGAAQCRRFDIHPQRRAVALGERHFPELPVSRDAAHALAARESTYLVTGGGDGGPEDAKRFLVDSPAPLIDMETAHDEARRDDRDERPVNREWSMKFREQGGRSSRCAWATTTSSTSSAWSSTCSMPCSFGCAVRRGVDAAGIRDNCAPYFETLFRAPVKLMPHLWRPVVLDREAASCPRGRNSAINPAAAAGVSAFSSRTFAW